MKIAIIGASAAGIYTALLAKKNHPDWEVVLFDHNAKIGKKILSTGNGHCNLLNEDVAPEAYSHPEFVRPLLRKHSYLKLKETLVGFGIPLQTIGSLVYPMTYSAASVVHVLALNLRQLGVKVMLNEDFLGYRAVKGKILVQTYGKETAYDKLVLATGGKSQKALGSDGSVLEMLKGKGYKITPINPGLCPIKCKEDVKVLSGVRHKAMVTLLYGGRVLYSENGEVLWKRDGLSGIAIFNCSSYIARQNPKNAYTVLVDLFPESSLDDLVETAEKAYESLGENFLDGLVEKALVQYIYSNAEISKPQKSDIPLLCRMLKSLKFHYEGLYPFDQSQISVGGVAIEELGPHLESKQEKGVFFAGEMIDIDGLCGGYNLSWCLLSALAVAEGL